MTSPSESFWSGYDTNITSVETVMKEVDEEVRKIEYSEMEPDWKPSDITPFAARKQELNEKKNKLEAEICKAKTFYAQLSNIREDVSNIDEDMNEMELKLVAIKDSRYKLQYQRGLLLFKEKRSILVQKENNISSEVAKLEHFK